MILETIFLASNARTLLALAFRNEPRKSKDFEILKFSQRLCLRTH